MPHLLAANYLELVWYTYGSIYLIGKGRTAPFYVAVVVVRRMAFLLLWGRKMSSNSILRVFVGCSLHANGGIGKCAVPIWMET